MLPQIMLKHDCGDSQAAEEDSQEDIPGQISSDAKLIPERHSDNQQDNRSRANRSSALRLTIAHFPTSS
jgi:hypothetical protein